MIQDNRITHNCIKYCEILLECQILTRIIVLLLLRYQTSGQPEYDT